MSNKKINELQELLEASSLVPRDRIRVKQSTLCRMLDITSQTVKDLLASDPGFPKPLKQGNARQGALYFDYDEIIEWHESLKQSR